VAQSIRSAEVQYLF